MRRSSIRTRARIVATLATLQSGIEPVALALLAANHAVDPADFGWIVGAGQIGMAAGALLGWLDGKEVRRALRIGPAIGVVASLALSIAHGLPAILVLRLVLGIVMGGWLTRATAIAARERPHKAIGTIFLSQQLLSTAVLAGLPVVAGVAGPSLALCVLVAAPLAIGMLVREVDWIEAPPIAGLLDTAARDATIGRDLAPLALILAVTMMLWSYVGEIGTALGLREIDIGFAIALGSLASAPAAVLAAFSGPRFQPWFTALACGIGMLTPLLVPDEAGLPGYLAALVLFNAGSTFGIIRFSGWAMERRAQGAPRRFVVLIQCLAMAGGPALGAIAMRGGGPTALGVLAATGLTIAMLVPILRIDRDGYPAIKEALAG